MSKKKNGKKNNSKKEISPLGRAMIESVINHNDSEFSEDLDDFFGRRPYDKDKKGYNYVNSPIE